MSTRRPPKKRGGRTLSPQSIIGLATALVYLAAALLSLIETLAGQGRGRAFPPLPAIIPQNALNVKSELS